MRYAYFNPHDGRVLQWLDTEAMSYNLPDESMLHECSEAEWNDRYNGEKMVKEGAIVDYVAPIKTQEDLNAEAWRELQSSAQAELGRSDITILRCVENGVSVPADWTTYRQALRAIISAPVGNAGQGLPAKPSYPPGT